MPGLNLGVFRFSGGDPSRNLAAEEVLFETLPDSTVLVGTYRNDRSIVCGKHQNPWLEIDVPAARARSVPIHRRITGGGTVFHDRGNLVFSVMTSRDTFDRRHNLTIVKETLRSFGIAAEITDGNDVYVGSRKVSGNAFCFRRNRAIHHGTLLVDADRATMHQLLAPAEREISTYAVRSRLAHTVNLREIEPSLRMAALEERFVEIMIREASPASVVRISETKIPSSEVDSLTERNNRWEWRFGRTPRFEVNVGTGSVSCRLVVNHGVIESVETPNADKRKTLVGSQFIREEMLMREVEGMTRRLVEASTLL